MTYGHPVPQTRSDPAGLVFAVLAFTALASGALWILDGAAGFDTRESFFFGLGAYLFGLALFAGSLQALGSGFAETNAGVRAVGAVSAVLGGLVCLVAAGISAQGAGDWTMGEASFELDTMMSLRYLGIGLMLGVLLVLGWLRKSTEPSRPGLMTLGAIGVVASLVSGIWMASRSISAEGLPNFYGGLGIYFVGTALILAPMFAWSAVRARALNVLPRLGAGVAIAGGILIVWANLEVPTEDQLLMGFGFYTIGLALCLTVLLPYGLAFRADAEPMGRGAAITSLVGCAIMLLGGIYDLSRTLQNSEEFGGNITRAVNGGIGLLAVGAGLVAAGWLFVQWRVLQYVRTTPKATVAHPSHVKV